MSEITIVKNEQGKVEGFGEKGRRAWNRFLKAVRELGAGETLSFSYHFPRSPKFHRLHMKMMASLYDAQEQFDNETIFRKWVEVGAGHCVMVPGPEGRMCAIPDSISYERLDDEQFSAVHEDVKKFVRGDRYLMFLYPHLEPLKAADMVEAIVRPFEERH